MAWHRPAAAARPRAEAALRALAEGRRKLAHGQEAVQQLLQDLEDLVGLGLGLGRFFGGKLYQLEISWIFLDYDVAIIRNTGDA